MKKIILLTLIMVMFSMPCLAQSPNAVLDYYILGQRQGYYNQMLELERQKLLIQQGYVAYGCKIKLKLRRDKNLTVWIRPDGSYVTDSGWTEHPEVVKLVRSVMRKKSYR